MDGTTQLISFDSILQKSIPVKRINFDAGVTRFSTLYIHTTTDCNIMNAFKESQAEVIPICIMHHISPFSLESDACEKSVQ